MRQALVVERDLDSGGFDEIARARAGDGKRRPLGGRVVNEDAAGVETILPPEFEPHPHRVGVARRAGNEKTIFAEAQRHPIVEHDARFLQQKAVADLAGLQGREAVIAVKVGEFRRVGADDLDLAERGAVEQRDCVARPRRLALDREVRVVGAVPGRPKPAAVFAHLPAFGPVLGLERQAPERIDERTSPPAGDDAHRHGDERRAIGGRSGLVDGAAGERRHRGEAVDVGRLALIGRHAKRRVALQVLDRDVALARGKRDVLQRHVVLEIDPSPAVCVGLGPGRFDAIEAGRRVRGGSFAPARTVALAQRRVERESAVGGAGDGEIRDPAYGRERGQGLVIAQFSARLGVKMDASATSRRRGEARRSRASARSRGPLRRRGSQ